MLMSWDSQKRNNLTSNFVCDAKLFPMVTEHADLLSRVKYEKTQQLVTFQVGSYWLSLVLHNSTGQLHLIFKHIH